MIRDNGHFGIVRLANLVIFICLTSVVFRPFSTQKASIPHNSQQIIVNDYTRIKLCGFTH